MRSTLLSSLLISAALVGTARAELVRLDTLKYKPELFGATGPDASKVTSFSTNHVPTDKMDVVLGMGFDYLTGTIGSEPCVLQASTPDVITPKDAKTVSIGDRHEYINSVSDMASNESASSDSGGFTFTYKLISLGGDAETTRENYFNNVDAYARIYSRLIVRSKERIGGKWSKTASADVKKRDKAAFLGVCGTHYVAAVYYGSVIDQTLKFSLNKTSQTQAGKDSLTLGIGELFGGHYDHTDREKKVRDVSSISIVDNSRGILAKAAPNPTTDGGVQAAAIYAHTQFPIDIAASSPDQSEALYVDVVPYYKLGEHDAPSVPKLSEKLMARIAVQAELFETLLSQISDMNNAKGLSDTAYGEFYKTDKSAIPGLLKDATDLRVNFATAVDVCYKIIKAYKADDPNNACTKALSDVLSPAKLDKVKLERK